MLEIGRRNRRRYDGFSLLELLVVLVIISVMTGVALLGWPRSTMPRHLDLRLSDLRTRMDIGADHAVLSGAAVGLQLTPGHYRFVGMTVDGTWRPVGVSLLQGQFVLPGDGVELDVDGRAVRLDGVREKNLVRRPALTVDELGEWPRFEIRIRQNGQEIRLSGGEDKPLHVSRAP